MAPAGDDRRGQAAGPAAVGDGRGGYAGAGYQFRIATLLQCVICDDGRRGATSTPPVPPILLATILRPQGATGVQTHVAEVERYLRSVGHPVELVTPFSAGGLLRDLTFAPRPALVRVSGPAAVLWYRRFHSRYL